jgi:hypothetical protein
MGKPKFLFTSNQDESNAKVTMGQTSVTLRRALVISDMSCVVETIPQFTRDVLSKKSYRNAYPQLGVKNTLLQHKANIPYKLNQELHVLK